VIGKSSVLPWFPLRSQAKYMVRTINCYPIIAHVLTCKKVIQGFKLPRGKKLGKFNGVAPSSGYNSVSGALFHMKLSEDIEQKLR